MAYSKPNRRAFMSTYVEDFAELNKDIAKARSKVLTIIFNYLQLFDYENLQLYYGNTDVKELLLPIELDFLDSLINDYYGEDSEETFSKKKVTH